jgi:hypothetical protein
MKLLGWFLLTCSVILGWLSDSVMIGIIFAMLAFGVIWLLAAFFEALKPGRRI